MKKSNLLICLLITIFSCTQNTNQITPIKSTSSPIINNSISNSSKESKENKLIQIENPDYKNIDLSNFNKIIYLTKDNDKYDSKRSYQEYKVALDEDDIYIKPSILISNKDKFIQDNDIKNFKLQSLSDNAKVNENGLVIIKEKTDFFEVEITHTPSNFKEIFKVTIEENKNYLDYTETVKFYGDVFTPDDKELKNVNVFFKSMDNIENINPKILSNSYYTRDTNNYLFKKAITGSRLIIIASKKGYSTRVRSEVLKSGIPDPQLNKYDFSTIYGLQNEPEINYLEVNGNKIMTSSNGDVFMTSRNNPKNIKPTIEELSTIEQIKDVGNKPQIAIPPYIRNSNNVPNQKLEVKMCFSEEVNKQSVEDNFRIQSQNNINGFPESELIDKNNSNLKFEWYKKKFSESIPEYLEETPCVKLSSDSYLKTNLKGEEARYLIDFKAPFQDLEGNKAIDRRYFRFSPSQINDFAVFSVMNGN
ncbi:MAG: hypothetical protein U0354_12735 [Candidatus Sericytochromatia bacterium]